MANNVIATLHEAQNDYIYQWEKNAKQHFLDGDYDWVANLAKSAGAKRILEIGCGVGYSTLALANRGIQTLSVDPIPEAINKTKKLLRTFKVSVGILGDGTKPDIILKQANAIEGYEEVSSYTQWIDLVLICNPGGKLETSITEKELEMLHWGHYSDEQMKEETVPALHKWAVILAAARLAQENQKKLIIVDRGSCQGIDDILNIIEFTTKMKGVGRKGRLLRKTPVDGIQLDGSSEEQLYWGAGLYIPN